MEGNQVQTITKFAAPKSSKDIDEVFRKKVTIDLDKKEAMDLFGLEDK